MPQGVSADLIAHKIRVFNATTSTPMRCRASSARRKRGRGRFKNSVGAGEGCHGLTILAKDEHWADHDDAVARPFGSRHFVAMGQMGGFDAVADPVASGKSSASLRPSRRQFVCIVDGAGAVLLGSKEAGVKHGLKARAKIRAFANIAGAGDDADGPVDVTEKLFERSGMRNRTSICSN